MISLNYIREVRIMAMEFREKDLDLQNIRKNLDSLITYKSEIVNENAKNSQKKIVSLFRARFGSQKTIWVWSGFVFEYLKNDAKGQYLLKNIDVLVDGPFMQQLFQLNLAFGGSLNQRIIDITRSLSDDKTVYLND